MINPDLKNVAAGVMATIIVILSGLLVSRYSGSSLSFNYIEINAKVPLHFFSLENKSTLINDENLSLLKMYLRNESDTSIGVIEIKIIGVREFYGINYSYKDSINKIELKYNYDKKNSELVLKNIPNLIKDKEMNIYIWGSFSDSYIEFSTPSGIYEASEGYLVTGSEKFFSEYWKLVLTVWLISIVLVIYSMKAYQVSDHEQKK